MSDKAKIVAKDNWQDDYQDMISKASDAVKRVRPGQRVFVGTGCAMPQTLVNALTARAGQLADTLVDVTDELVKAMPHLRKRSHMDRILKHGVEINRLENEADSIVRFALAELFDDMPIADVIKWREIYGHLEDAVDKAEDVANVLEGVVLKHG